MPSSLSAGCISGPISAVIALLVCFGFCYPANSQTRQKFEEFTHDPAWTGVNHRIPVNFPRRVLQRFGWCRSNFSGEQAGEIGGYITNCVQPAHYAKPLDRALTFSDPLEMSGSFALIEGRSIMGYDTMSNCYIGFFNKSGQGWRGKNFLGIKLCGMNEPDGAFVELLYATSTGGAGGKFLLTDGQERTGLIRELDFSKVMHIAPDGKRHFFKLSYQPGDGTRREGEIRLTIDQYSWTKTVDPVHFSQGILLNRCGLVNEQLPGNAMVVYLDDISINGQLEPFTSDPHWEGVGNDTWLEDDCPYGSQDYGYQASDFAGGKPGEVGGRLWRTHELEDRYAGYFADDVGSLTLNDHLEARGKIAIPMLSTDSGACIGWFHEGSSGWFPSPFIGVNLDSNGPALRPRFFMPMYGFGNDKQGELLPPTESPAFSYGPESHEFSIIYDPGGADGKGVISVTLDDQRATLPLQAVARKQGGILNRFGLMNMQDNNGKYSIIYLDDLEYTTGLPSAPVRSQ